MSMLRRSAQDVRVVIALWFVFGFLLSGLLVNASDTRLTMQLAGDQEECFFESVKVVDSSVFFQFLTVMGGDRGVDAKVLNPSRKVIWETFAVEEDRVLFNAWISGEYLFCLHNGGSGTKVVSFKVATLDPAKNADRSANKVLFSINRILTTLSEIEELQNFLRTRERHHRTTVETANSRVLTWSVIEAVIILAFGYFNVVLLRRMFTKKRAV